MYKLNVMKLNKEAKLPTRNNQFDAGVDLYALEDSFIEVGETKKIPTGIAIQIPEGYVGKIEDRSGMASRGLRTGAGVVDCGYSGELSVVVHNFSADDTTITSLNEHFANKLKLGYTITKGDKIAQLLIYKFELPRIEEVTELWSSERGNKGFNSSGR